MSCLPIRSSYTPPGVSGTRVPLDMGNDLGLSSLRIPDDQFLASRACLVSLIGFASCIAEGGI